MLGLDPGVCLESAGTTGEPGADLVGGPRGVVGVLEDESGDLDLAADLAADGRHTAGVGFEQDEAEPFRAQPVLVDAR